jgi:hypothetical protein
MRLTSTLMASDDGLLQESQRYTEPILYGVNFTTTFAERLLQHMLCLRLLRRLFCSASVL